MIKIHGKSLDGKSFPIQVNLIENMANLKQQINEVKYCKDFDQKLYFRGVVLNDDNKLINELDIKNHECINVICRYRGGTKICVKVDDGRTVSFEVLKTDTIIDVKKKIQEKMGIAPAFQRLVFNGKSPSDDITVGDWGISDDSVINLIKRQQDDIQIWVETLDKRKVDLIVSIHDKIIDVKMKIQVKLTIPPDEQKLIFNGKILDNDSTVDECHIIDQSELRVVERLRGGLI